MKTKTDHKSEGWVVDYSLEQKVPSKICPESGSNHDVCCCFIEASDTVTNGVKHLIGVQLHILVKHRVGMGRTEVRAVREET